MDRKKTVKLAKIAICLLCVFFVGVMLFIGNMRRPVRYVIPHGYSGWISVKYSVAKATALPLEEGFLLAIIPIGGKLETTSPLEERWGADQYYQVDKNGERKRLVAYGHSKDTMIWAGSTNGSRLRFFCGTRSQLLSTGNGKN